MQRQQPARRLRHRYTPARRRGFGWRGRLVVVGGFILVCLVGWAFLARLLAPVSNTNFTRFDAIVVLGYPADSDGNPTPRQLARVTEGVHEYGRGVAPRLILTGGAAHNGYVEAEVMARIAEAQGIPRSAIYVEPKANDTIENACYAVRIMKEHGWKSAEVVSSASHLPRAALIFEKLPVQWRVHGAPAMEPESSMVPLAESTVEVVKMMRFLTYAQWAERCEP